MKSLPPTKMIYSIWKILCKLNITAWLSRQEKSGGQQGSGLRDFHPDAASLPHGTTLLVLLLACRILTFGSKHWMYSFFQESRLHQISGCQSSFSNASHPETTDHKLVLDWNCLPCPQCWAPGSITGWHVPKCVRGQKKQSASIPRGWGK